MNESKCPFCLIVNNGSKEELIANNEHAVAFLDKYPLNEGHVLVIPKRHESDFFNLSIEEQLDAWKLLDQVQVIVSQQLGPDGFNVGINISESAGQTIEHAHIHLIPRYKGDVKDPRGGVRWVVPPRAPYWEEGIERTVVATDSKSSFAAGEIINYREMCEAEKSQLQRGMNFRLSQTHSVLLMSRRDGAPYDDEIINDGVGLIYEGHDVPKSISEPYPKLQDQELQTPKGASTQNGKFFNAAQDFKSRKRDPEPIRVYEKLKVGIWVFAGTFDLVDAWLQESGIRKVFKFQLNLVSDTSVLLEADRRSDHLPLLHTRLIPSQVKQEVFKRDKGECVECGSKDNLHFDHVIPFSKGGSSLTPVNIQLLCARHNLEKSDSIR
jgi:diadenosine tetraphosphate (Ap4A) HIT family hydrolase